MYIIIVVSAGFGLALALGIRLGIGNVELLEGSIWQARRAAVGDVAMADVGAGAGTGNKNYRNTEG